MKKLITICAVVAMCAAAVPSLGTMIYTNEAGFTSQLQPGYYLQEFSAYNGYGAIGPQNFGPVNGFKYTISASPGGLYKVPAGAGAISTLYGDDILNIAFTGATVKAVGGRFFGTDYNGNWTTATIRVALNDGTIENYTNTNIADFRGFISSTAISSLSIRVPGSHHDDGPYPTVDHLYVGVPEPATVGILGLGALSLLRRKK